MTPSLRSWDDWRWANEPECRSACHPFRGAFAPQTSGSQRSFTGRPCESSAQRIAELAPRLQSELGPALADRAKEVLALTEMAWHDCYGEVSPPASVVDDILVVADGDLGRLVQAALLAVTDFRDLRVAADAER